MDKKQLNKSISEQRSKNYLKQVQGSFVFKTLAILASFLLVPIMIKYLGNEQYGIWSTLLSIISWIVLFDLGIGNGLRNKISESIAKNNRQNAQKYISTSYVSIGSISVILIIILLTISNYINWQRVFNTSILSNHELSNIVGVAIFFMLLNFWLSLINQVVNGLQKSSVTVFNQFVSNSLSLIFIYLLSIFTETSLFYLVVLYGISLVISNIGISVWFYKKNKDLLPKVSLFEKRFFKSITSLGVQFFIIQIAVVVIFSTDKIIITQLFGPADVTSYDVIFKLFTVVTIAHGILITPLWSAYSDAYHRNDFLWIQSIIISQLKIFIVLCGVTILLVLLASNIVSLWIGKSIIEVNSALIYSMGVFTVISVWNNIFAYLLNGANVVKVQIYTSIMAIIINIPLSIFIVKYFETGIFGVVIATSISLSFFAIAGPVQSYLLIKKGVNNE